jgi:hypothetical protein
MAVTYSGDAATTRTNLGLGSLATLSSVNAATITDNSVGAAELNVSGNGTTSQYLRSDGDGSMTWASISVSALTTASGSAPSYSARAWVNFNGTGTVSIRASGNVSSITDNGTGDYSMNFSTALPDANLVFTALSQQTLNSSYWLDHDTVPYTWNSSSVRMRHGYGATTLIDQQVMVAAVYR